MRNKTLQGSGLYEVCKREISNETIIGILCVHSLDRNLSDIFLFPRLLFKEPLTFYCS